MAIMGALQVGYTICLYIAVKGVRSSFFFLSSSLSRISSQNIGYSWALNQASRIAVLNYTAYYTMLIIAML